MKIHLWLASLVFLSAAAVFATLPAEDKLAKQPADGMLANALQDPHIFMHGEQATSKTDPSLPHSFDLVITSAKNVDGKAENVVVRPGTMQIFRANPDVDAFTKEGGWYWKCGKVEGKSQFKEPGTLIMVVREQDGTVRWYSLHWDLRC